MNFLSESKNFRFQGTKIVKVREWADLNGIYIYRCLNREIRTLPITATRLFHLKQVQPFRNVVIL